MIEDQGTEVWERRPVLLNHRGEWLLRRVGFHVGGSPGDTEDSKSTGLGSTPSTYANEVE